MRLRSWLPIVVQLLLVAVAWPADFGQADLEKMVAELDKVIPENPKFKYPIKCSMVDEDKVNAYATVKHEGDDLRATMVVYTGLVKEIKGDERLIRAVVAHELSHLSRGHMTDIDPAARDLRNLWTRQQEYEADKYGSIALEKSGHSKQDMIDMLLFLAANQGRDGNWLDYLTADHADPKARAAAVSDNPGALKALVEFDTALAYEDARSHRYASRLFELAAAQWPALTESYVNAGKCGLLFYYDNLPEEVRTHWWRPDFGPLITTPRISGKGNVILDEDRERYRDAMKAIALAIEKNPGNLDALELQALGQVLEPDAKSDVVQLGVGWFKSHSASANNDVFRLRYANNAGLGLQRIGDLRAAYDVIMGAQRGSQTFNAALGENLGLVTVTGRSKDDTTLAANVMFTWLSNTPPNSPRWKVVKKTFEDTCAEAGIDHKEIKEKPAYLCRVVTLASSGKEMGILLPLAAFKGTLGEPEQTLRFDDRWPDFTEVHWHSDKIVVLTEKGDVMRVTSYEPDAYLLLKPIDSTSKNFLRIKVGMTKDELFSMLDEKAAVMKKLAKGPKTEDWRYFPELNMGVLMEDDKVVGITVTPVQYEPDSG